MNSQANTLIQQASPTVHSTESRECKKCLLNLTDIPGLQFNLQGLCSVCETFEHVWQAHLTQKSKLEQNLPEVISVIKKAGAGKKYDCVIGVSGGVDSSFLAWKVIQLGLRPLAVHFDNGWNSELAVHNIEQMVTSLGIDLYTVVVDWREFRDLQKAYLKASVIDVEVPTDHGIYATLYNAAIENNIQFILGGNNVATEGFMPRGWHYRKLDHINLLDIHRKFGEQKLRDYPRFDRRQKIKARRKSIKLLEILDVIEYSRCDAVSTISAEFGWRDYGVKHGESTFTKFYQEYLLPKKFGVEKKKAHLSTLIHTGEISRAEAIEEYHSSSVPEHEQQAIKSYVLKKLGFSESEFKTIMNAEPIAHETFEQEGSLFYEFRFLLPWKNTWSKFRHFVPLKTRSHPYEIR
ncbi:MAG: N-acetyl sugar amidotransferase [Pirellulales bacterium]|nr:N-acetyl sugar amidotransferase [Pirellulales bacterium]